MALDSLPMLRHEIYRAGQRFFRYELNKEEQDACLSQFKALDRNGDQTVTYQELLDKREIMGPSVAARVCRFFELVDRDGNGFLDFGECKALFFLVRKAHVCDECKGLIIHGGLYCLNCLPYSFKFCYSCARQQQQQQQHYQHLFQALPELINGSFQQKLPTVMELRVFPQQQQHYNHSHGFQSLPPDQFQQQQQHYRHSHGFQCQHPSDHHQAIAPSQAFHQDNNARTDSRGFMQTTGTVVAVVGSVAGVVNAINSCSIM